MLSLIRTALLLFGVLAAALVPVVAKADTSLRERISSSNGVSFQPPQGYEWEEHFRENEIVYLRKTDFQKVSFYVGVLEGKLRTKLLSDTDLLAFVRSKKNQWGTDGRYSNISTSFEVESDNETCVHYRMLAHDFGAKNRGSEAFLVMQTNGRFCLHPQDRTSAVDIYYSVRYLPTLDPRDLVSDGEIFVRSLQFHTPKR